MRSVLVLLEDESIFYKKQVDTLHNEIDGLRSVVELKNLELSAAKNAYQQLSNELVKLRNDFNEIKNSYTFHLVKNWTESFDKLLPDGTWRGEIKKDVAASLRMISNEGFDSYLKAVKEKISRGEFKIISSTPIYLDEKKILQDVAKRKKKRLSVKSSTEKENLLQKEANIVSTPKEINLEKFENITDEVIICTIISKNYISFARTLTDSFLKHNPKGKVFVLLVDQIDNYFDKKLEKFLLVDINEIGIDDLPHFCFKYTVLEQNTGVKAHFLSYLFKKYNLKKLIYVDPDILITNPLDNLWKILDDYSIVITPHILSPISDEKQPGELDIIRAGSYNLGFIALSNTDTTKNFLSWWSKRLLQYGYMNLEKGMHVDQKWIDLVPSLFENVCVLRHPGYNVAYWNLMSRNVRIENSKITVNNKPMYFFHFSGFSPENIGKVSKHQTRFELSQLKELKPIFELYRDLLFENGYLQTKTWPFHFDYFDNGIKIPSQARTIYSQLDDPSNFGNPFSTNSNKSFIYFLNSNVSKSDEKFVTRLWYQVYNDRKDLQIAYPDPMDKYHESFLTWINKSLQREYELDPFFIPQIPYLITGIANQHTIMHGKEPSLIHQKDNPFRSMDKSKPFGINLAGYISGEFGVAEEARNLIKAIQSVGIPYSLNNIMADTHRWNDKTFNNFSDDNPYKINLVSINADQADVFYQQKNDKYFRGHYNIAAWAWELSKFPDIWIPAARYYDEIWTVSNFMAECISKPLDIPVVKITYPLSIDENLIVPNRAKFSLKDNSYVFLFVFDFMSIFERKNPIAVVNSFLNAFNEKDNVSLVIKCINGKNFPEKESMLKKTCKDPRIKVIDNHISKADVISLKASCDCYVSLHRSEGFGLTMAEAMYLGKPVIVTPYGGNTDFMNVNNSFPVKYEIKELEEDYGPYKKGNLWAEPDENDAARLMKYVYEHKELGLEIGSNASNYIKKFMSPKVTGQEILARIERLK